MDSNSYANYHSHLLDIIPSELDEIWNNLNEQDKYKIISKLNKDEVMKNLFKEEMIDHIVGEYIEEYIETADEDFTPFTIYLVNKKFNLDLSENLKITKGLELFETNKKNTNRKNNTRKCKIGKVCGKTCIDKKRICRLNKSNINNKATSQKKKLIRNIINNNNYSCQNHTNCGEYEVCRDNMCIDKDVYPILNW